jgi:DNA-binding NarL/FixJ family response regulator
MQAMRLSALLWSGRWAALADELTRPARSDDRGTDVVMTGSVAAAWHTAQGRLDRAQEHLDRCRAIADDGGLTATMEFFWLANAEHCLGRGDPAGARDWVATGLARAARSDHAVLLGRLLVLGARAEADLGPARSRTTLAREVARLARIPHRSPFADALLVQARAELGRGRGASSPTEWAAVATGWAALGVPHHQAYARWRQAEALLAARRSRPQAARALGEALKLSTVLGATPLTECVEALARQARLDIAEAGVARPRAGVATADTSALTRREGQVLALIGQGCTNRQIARQLFISENTVSIHVSRILAKLGVPNRVAAATAATRLGLDRSA